MGAGKIIAIPASAVILLSIILFFALNSIRATEESRVTEIAQSLEINFNTMTQDVLNQYIDKDSLQKGIVTITESNKNYAKKELERRLTEYMQKNYAGQIYIPGLSASGTSDIYGGFRVSNGTLNIKVEAGDNVHAKAINGRTNGFYNTEMKPTMRELLPEITVSNNASNVNFNPVRTSLMRLTATQILDKMGTDPTGEYITGFYIGTAKGNSADINGTGSKTAKTNIYPFRFKVNAVAISYSDYSANNNNTTYTQNNDNRSKIANINYAVNDSSEFQNSLGGTSVTEQYQNRLQEARSNSGGHAGGTTAGSTSLNAGAVTNFDITRSTKTLVGEKVSDNRGSTNVKGTFGTGLDVMNKADANRYLSPLDDRLQPAASYNSKKTELRDRTNHYIDNQW